MPWYENSIAGPWTLVENGTITTAYYAGSANEATLHIARGTAAGPAQDVMLAKVTKGPSWAKNAANTDFANFAKLPDRRLVTVWTDGHSVFAATSR